MRNRDSYNIGDQTMYGIVVSSSECMDCKGYYAPEWLGFVYRRNGSGKTKRCRICIQAPAYIVVGRLSQILGLPAKQIRANRDLIRWWQVHMILKSKIKSMQRSSYECNKN